MQVLGVFGEESATEVVVDAILKALPDDDRVAVVSRDRTVTGHSALSSEIDRSGPHVAVSIDRDGSWRASGDEATVEFVLDDLAPQCAYALVVGDVDGPREIDLHPRYPRLAIGTDDPSADVTISDPSAIDVADVLALLGDAEAYETLESLVATVKQSVNEGFAGAIATFTGRVRERDDPDDAPTEYLEFEKYDGIAEERLEAIRSDLLARDGVHAVEMHHRTGVVEAGEDIVFVVVLAGHREEAFRTVRDGIDRLKGEVPLFKKEVTVEEEFWVHEGP